MQPKLTLLFDGGCPFCQREISFISSRDHLKIIEFVDIDSLDYNPDQFRGISYQEAMGTIHAITSSGDIITGVEVFRESYRLIGLGWIYAPTTWPVLGVLTDRFYGFWARWRLFLTRRPSLDRLCEKRNITPNKLL